MKKSNQILLISFLLLSVTLQAQVGIGTTTPKSSSILDLTATNKALLVTRVVNTAAIEQPINGMIIYVLTDNKFKIYQNNSWINMFL